MVHKAEIWSRRLNHREVLLYARTTMGVGPPQPVALANGRASDLAMRMNSGGLAHGMELLACARAPVLKIELVGL